MQTLHQLTGITTLLALCWLLSERRASVQWRTVAAGLTLGLLLAVALLKLPALRALVEASGYRGFHECAA